MVREEEVAEMVMGSSKLSNYKGPEWRRRGRGVQTGREIHPHLIVTGGGGER